MVAPLRADDPLTIGPYRLLGQLGCGGMGRVFLGLTAGGRPIAVKIVRAELAADPEFRARFRQEVDAARKVSGVFTAPVVDADLDGPVPWLATAYVSGPSLSQAVRSHGPLPVNTVLALAAGLAEGLSAIHAAGVVHGDLKPSNVLLAQDGPRVIDFGISQGPWAKPLPGMDFGSPGFISPEQALGLEIGPPSDIFSLGAVLTFAATGQGPFGSGSSAALVCRVASSPARLGHLPEELQELVGSCLAKDPDDRPTASRLLADVGAIPPESGWLPKSVSAMFTQGQAAIRSLGPEGAAGASSDQPRPGLATRRPGRRFSRSLTPVWWTGGVLAASAAVFFAVTGSAAPSPATHTQPRAGAELTAPAPASYAPATGNPSPPRHPHQISPSILQGPSTAQFLSPSAPVPASPNPFDSAAASPSGSPSASSSASPSSSSSASPSASPSASASPSPSPSTSASPSPSPSASPSPSPSPSASPSPSPSPSASPSPSPSTASSSPTTAPPSSASPTTAPPSSPSVSPSTSTSSG